jgi:hypothetical protein
MAAAGAVVWSESPPIESDGPSPGVRGGTVLQLSDAGARREPSPLLPQISAAHWVKLDLEIPTARQVIQRRLRGTRVGLPLLTLSSVMSR